MASKNLGSVCQCHVNDIFLDRDTMDLHPLHNFEVLGKKVNKSSRIWDILDEY